MLFTHVASSFHSLRANRLHSLLTIFGIMVGVGASVLALNTIDGARQQILKEVDLRNNIVVVRSGDSIKRNPDDQSIQYDITQKPGGALLTLHDLDVINELPSVSSTSPLVDLSFEVSSSRQITRERQVIGTTDNFIDLTGWQLSQGTGFNDGITKEAVLGSEVAVELFNGREAVGQGVHIQGYDFVVRGILATIPHGSVSLGPNYNQAIIIPIDTIPSIVNQDLLIYEIMVTPTGDSQTTVAAIDNQLLLNHQRKDFSVFEWAELLGATSRAFYSMTIMVAIIATVILVISGTGIMNIMLANVAERTREIGIRKAVGGSKADIMKQFLTEAIVLSLLGGLMGIALAGVASLAIGFFTDLQPTFEVNVILGATLVSVMIGVIFGVGPAHRAAQKEPVEALRS